MTGVIFNTGHTANYFYPGDVLTATGTNTSDYSEVVLSSGGSANGVNGVTSYTIQDADTGASVDFDLAPGNGGSTYTFSCSPGTAPPAASAATITAAFSPTTITTAQTSTLTLTITNPNAATTLSGLAVSAGALPANLNGSSPANTCGGTATFAGGNLSLSGASLAQNSSCTVTLTVSSTTPANYSYTSGTVSSSSPSTTGGTATTPTSLTVNNAANAPIISAAFSPTPINTAQTSTLTLTISNPNVSASLTGVAVSASPLPPNLNGSGPATNCGGTATFAAGSLSLSGGSLAAGAVCTVTLTVSSTTPASYTYVTGQPSASGTTAGTSATANLMVLAVSSTTLTSSVNPSSFGQAVTFTATVTGTTPTGTVTFKDGATTIGSGPVSGGHASFTISTLALGTHAITAVYSGDGSNASSTSAILNQAVGVPGDSIKLQALQVAVTKLEAQASGSATSSAIDSAISEGFNDNGTLISGSDNGMHVNFAAEPEKQSAVEQRVGDAFAALGYAKRDQQPVFKAPVYAAPPKEWLAWLDVRGTGWNTNVQSGDIHGSQVNALAGLTRRITSDFIVGVFGGYESFDYTSQLLNGRLKGDGWTVGSYLGWRFMPGLRFDAGIARSGVNYDGTAGTATGTFPGQRWLLTTGFTGTYKTAPGFVIEPSAKVYALWEHEDAYNDNLGTAHPDRNFSTGRASLGAKVAYPWLSSSSVTITPYVGLYSDYYFNQDDAVALGAPNLLPTEFVHGLSARVTSGVAFSAKDGKSLSLGGEYGGLGNDFSVWSVRARGSVPF